MSEWTDGYRAALGDLQHLAHSRKLLTKQLNALIDDLDGDALVIERQRSNQVRRKRLAVVREALPLFPGEVTP